MSNSCTCKLAHTWTRTRARSERRPLLFYYCINRRHISERAAGVRAHKVHKQTKPRALTFQMLPRITPPALRQTLKQHAGTHKVNKERAVLLLLALRSSCAFYERASLLLCVCVGRSSRTSATTPFPVSVSHTNTHARTSHTATTTTTT